MVTQYKNLIGGELIEPGEWLDVVNPANEFRMGQRDEFMLIRVCAEVQRILPLSGWGLNLTRDNNDNLHMTSASGFVNEPTAATGP